MHSETTKFKQSVQTLVSPVSSIGVRDINIMYITPTMILNEDMKPIEHVLHHQIGYAYFLTWCAHANTVI